MEHKVTIIPIVIGAFGTVTEGLIKGLEDLEISERVKSIQTTTFLTSARILRRILGTCCPSDSSERPLGKTDVKNYPGVRKMCNAYKEKLQATSNRRNGTTKARQDWNACRKRNLQIFGHLGG